MELRIEREIEPGSGASRRGTPVYRQIAEQIRGQVERGELRAGDRLPPIRELARALAVNRDTVSLAYEALAAEGLLEARVGRGTFVRTRPVALGSAGLAREIELAPGAERLLDFERARPRYGRDGAIPLHAVAPDPALYPVDAFRRSLTRALSSDPHALLGYAEAQGHEGLREVLAERLSAQGTRIGPESVVVCQGASQGIALALRLFAERGDAVAVEEPTYQNALGTLFGLGLRPVAVPMRPDGPDLATLDRVLARPEVKLFYTIPTFHNPTGICTSLDHREALLRVAEHHGKPVVEDAFEQDLRFMGRPLPALAGLDEAGLVVHLMSFSKSLFPGLRCGAIIARGKLVEALLALRHAADLGGALPLQAALADFLRSGGYDRHLGALRREVKLRRDAALEVLAEAMPDGTRFTRPEGGYQIWVELPEGADTRELLADALRAGVTFAPGFQFQHDGRASNAMRLSIGMADEAAIRDGIARLGRIAHDHTAPGHRGPVIQV